MNAFHDLQARLKVVQKVGENIEKNKKPYLL
jgi:hypothetical protein